MFAYRREDLESIRRECLRMSNKRAIISAAASVLPVPFTDIATDIMLLRDIIPKITQKFGLAKDQIDSYDPQMSIVIYQAAREIGAKIAGRLITRDILIGLLKKMGIKRLTAKQIVKYVPIIGQAFSAGISYAGMMFIIRHHISECHRIAQMTSERLNLAVLAKKG